jgi:hypothetical protein
MVAPRKMADIPVSRRSRHLQGDPFAGDARWLAH